MLDRCIPARRIGLARRGHTVTCKHEHVVCRASTCFPQALTLCHDSTQKTKHLERRGTQLLYPYCSSTLCMRIHSTRARNAQHTHVQTQVLTQAYINLSKPPPKAPANRRTYLIKGTSTSTFAILLPRARAPSQREASWHQIISEDGSSCLFRRLIFVRRGEVVWHRL